MFGFGTTTAQVHIIARLDKKHKAKGRHNLSIEVVPAKKLSDSLRRRDEEGIYEEDDSIVPPSSPAIELELSKEKTCEIQFQLTGGLQPVHPLAQVRCFRTLLISLVFFTITLIFTL